MNQKQKDIAAKWVEALRSGKYQQGTEYLLAVDEDGVQRFCCLGVLCDIIPSVSWFNPNDASQVKAVFRDSYSAEDLPFTLTTYVGLRSDAGVIDSGCEGLRHYRGEPTLAALNDNGVTFAQIADLIETYPEAIFYDLPEPETGEDKA